MSHIISDACYYLLLLCPLKLADMGAGSKTLVKKKMRNYSAVHKYLYIGLFP